MHRFNSSLKITFLSEWCAKEKLMRVGGTQEEKFTASTPAQGVFSAMKLRGYKVWDMVGLLLVKPHQPHPWLCPPGWPPGESVKAMALGQWPLVLTKGFAWNDCQEGLGSLFSAAWIQGCGQWLWTWSYQKVVHFGTQATSIDEASLGLES